MDIWSELTTDESHMSGLKTMIGKNTSTQILANESRKLIVPLQFWFCKNIGLALPLVSLQYHEVKLQVSLRPFNQCWKKPVKRYFVEVDSTHTNRLNINTAGVGDINTSFLSGDVYSNQKLIWESDGVEQNVSSRIDSDTIELSSTNTAGKTGYVYLLLDEPDRDYSLEDVRLYCDYIYLDTNERKFFAQNTHIYLIEQVQFSGNTSYQTSQDSNKISLEFNHPCKELLWVTQMDLSRTFNEHLNFSSSVDITYGDNPIENSLLYINGQERFSQRNADHFRLEIPYKRHTRVPDNFIYVCIVFIKTRADARPSGTCNFSILDSAELLINYRRDLPASNTRVIWFEL